MNEKEKFERFGSESKKSKAVMVQGNVQAGFPSPAQDYLESPLDLNDLLIPHPASTFFVKAAGESMVQAGINDGDILIVDRSLNAVDGNIVITAVNGEFTVKYLRQKKGELVLEPANPNFDSISMKEGDECRLWGVVTAVVHRFLV